MRIFANLTLSKEHQTRHRFPGSISDRLHLYAQIREDSHLAYDAFDRCAIR